MNTINRKSVLAFAAGSLATASIAMLIAAGPEHKDHDHADHANHADKVTQPEMDEMMEMSTEDMMAAMAVLATPGEHHKALEKSIGTWTAKTSFVMDPAAPPTEGVGTMTTEWVLGKRFTKSVFKTNFMGDDFEGLAYAGYDIAHEEYVSTWMDTMSTKITSMTGQIDKDGTMTMMGMATTPMGDNPMKMVTTWQGDDQWTDQFYDLMPDGSWYNSATIVYTRN